MPANLAGRPKWDGPVQGPPPKNAWTKKDLIDHVRTGMRIELSTIPIYFCALYSIKPDNGGWGTKARSSILAVAEQEMLHLALAGNMLAALDGIQPLYDWNFMPSYPSRILYDKIDMKLQPANKDNLGCFLKIEAPYMLKPIPPPGRYIALSARKPPEDIVPEYQSIGEFYKELERGIINFDVKQDKELFSHNTERQFRGEEFFYTQMTVITDKKSALTALETIVDQGEGSIGVPDSHYATFVKLHEMQKEWVCVQYVDNPRTEYYKGKNDVAHRLSLAVDASYCYLLQTIDSFWGQEMSDLKRQQVLRNMHRIMVAVLSPTAHALVEQKIEGGRFAAPCFEFYPPPSKEASESTPLTPQELFDALKKELVAAQDAATGDTKEKIAKIIFSLDGIGPV